MTQGREIALNIDLMFYLDKYLQNFPDSGSSPKSSVKSLPFREKNLEHNPTKFIIICKLYMSPVFKFSHDGLGVERWSDNRLHSAPVDRISLGETIPAMSMFHVYMVPTPTDMCYKYK